ncbi:B3 domain-containing protein Os03g0212300-like isoform X2 [Punica granatum]|uniref:B3 domain-containing protein Os03g0212300-like isoform X2 n=1 Tax=Punica granatum TaxID=22663 RepID=A0A6P8E151_PUNGR|nr:B3 domain-containing protein Os03g0212300-like isoform X2 [Punica granatum]
MSDPRTLKFFKFFLVSQSKEHLKIPQAHCKLIKGWKPRIVLLSGPSGNTWRVSLSQDQEKPDELYFKHGWPRFVKDHSLKDGDLLLFQCLGKSKYKVEIFDPSGCPKEAAFNGNSFQGTFNIEKCRGWTSGKSYHDSSEAGEPSSARTLKFNMTICNSQHAYMNIPKHFAMSNALLNKVTLQDPSGKLWPAKIRFQVRPCPQFIIFDGWYEFCKSNKLKIGDICALELLPGNEESDNLLMSVCKLNF